MNYEQKTICFARMSAIFCVHTHHNIFLYLIHKACLWFYNIYIYIPKETWLQADVLYN